MTSLTFDIAQVQFFYCMYLYLYLMFLAFRDICIVCTNNHCSSPCGVVFFLFLIASVVVVAADILLPV